ncbi:hypothetical protein Tco_0587675 [Tanacetum coccineum]
MGTDVTIFLESPINSPLFMHSSRHITEDIRTLYHHHGLRLTQHWQRTFDVGDVFSIPHFQPPSLWKPYDLKKILSQCRYPVSWYLSFGRHLDELHVTWAHLEKKRTRLQTNNKTLEDLCSQSLETASQAIHDAVTTHQVTASHHFMMASARTDSNTDLEDSSYDGVIDTAQKDKNEAKRTKPSMRMKRVREIEADGEFILSHASNPTCVDWWMDVAHDLRAPNDCLGIGQD